MYILICIIFVQFGIVVKLILFFQKEEKITRCRGLKDSCIKYDTNGAAGSTLAWLVLEVELTEVRKF